jgi:hypothetical protein
MIFSGFLTRNGVRKHVRCSLSKPGKYPRSYEVLLYIRSSLPPAMMSIIASGRARIETPKISLQRLFKFNPPSQMRLAPGLNSKNCSIMQVI